MFRGRTFTIVVLSAILVSGCSQMPGLRVLTGQTEEDAAADLTVQALDLVMADKSGSADPGITAAANRIEAADNMVDIIEVRKDEENRDFIVNMLLRTPDVDANTQEGQIAIFESRRRAFEVTWQGMMPESERTDRITIRMLAPASVSTLDHGQSFVGVLMAEAAIERADAAAYLAGARNINTFYDLIVNGMLQYQAPNETILYEGTPNHPMFMLAGSAASTS